MTLNQLKKQIDKLVEQGCGRRRVSIKKDSFQDNRENDGVTILPVEHVDVDWIPDADDDGGIATNKHGGVVGRWLVILGGASYEKREIPPPATAK